MRDVAEAAGVSLTTVSVVLGDTPNSGIPDATKQRVLRAARELGYVRNVSARSLRTRRSHTLGFLSDSIATSPFAGETIAGAQAAAWERGHVLLVIDTGGREELAETAARALLERRVEHVIVAAMFHHAVEVPSSLRSHRTMLVNCFDAGGEYPAIVPDEEAGGYTATARLLERHPAPVGFICPTLAIPAGTGRLAGYRKALGERGVPVDESYVVFSETLQTPEGYRCADDLLDRHPDLRLLFCGNDRTAMGAFEAIKRRGLRIPEDVAVVGFDNQEIIAGGLLPALTTVALPHYEMGWRAAERLLGVEAGDERHATAGGSPELIACLLVERDSA
jgi:LacI family transcriptional regulator